MAGAACAAVWAPPRRGVIARARPPRKKGKKPSELIGDHPWKGKIPDSDKRVISPWAEDWPWEIPEGMPLAKLFGRELAPLVDVPDLDEVPLTPEELEELERLEAIVEVLEKRVEELEAKKRSEGASRGMRRGTSRGTSPTPPLRLPRRRPTRTIRSLKPPKASSLRRYPRRRRRDGHSRRRPRPSWRCSGTWTAQPSARDEPPSSPRGCSARLRPSAAARSAANPVHPPTSSRFEPTPTPRRSQGWTSGRWSSPEPPSFPRRPGRIRWT